MNKRQKKKFNNKGYCKTYKRVNSHKKLWRKIRSTKPFHVKPNMFRYIQLAGIPVVNKDKLRRRR